MDTELRAKKESKRYVKLFIRLRNLFETMGEAVLLIAPDGQIIQSNNAASNLFGLSRNTLERLNFRSPILSLQDENGPISDGENPVGIVLETGRPVYSREFQYHRPDSKTVHLRASASPLVNQGEFEGVLALFSDITELKNLSDKLKNTYNDNITDLKRVKSLLDLLTHDDIDNDSLYERILQMASKHWLSSEKLSIEMQIDGKYYSSEGFRPTDFMLSCPLSLDEKVAGYITVYYPSEPVGSEKEIPDILAEIVRGVSIRTKQQQAHVPEDNSKLRALEQKNKMLQLEIRRKDFRESELKRESAKLRAMLESSNLAFILLSPEFRILEHSVAANSTFEILYNRSIKNGQSILEIIPQADRKRFSYFFSLAMMGEGTNHEACITDENAISTWFNINLEPVKDDDNEIKSVCLFIMDITHYMDRESSTQW